MNTALLITGSQGRLHPSRTDNQQCAAQDRFQRTDTDFGCNTEWKEKTREISLTVKGTILKT